MQILFQMALQLKQEIIQKIRESVPIRRALEDYFGTPGKPMSVRNLDRYLSDNNARLTEYGSLMVIGSHLKQDVEDLICVTDESRVA